MNNERTKSCFINGLCSLLIIEWTKMNIQSKKYFMKITVSSVLFLLFSSFPLLAQEPRASKILQFEERVFDFGEIEEQDGIVSHEFTFRNTGTEMVYINGMSTGCGCVQYEFPKEPVRPGASGKVKVSYDPAYRPGFFSKEVVVLSNGNTNYNRIWVKGTVIPCRHPVEENYPYDYGSGLWMNFKVMLFGTMDEGDTKMMNLQFANDTDKDMRLFFVVIGGNTDIKFTSPQTLKAGGEGVMPVTYHYSGRFPAITRVYPVINGTPSATPLTVKVETE